METQSRPQSPFLYRQVIELITERIDTGVLKPGDRLPSLRQMSARSDVSIPTVRQAYVELERMRRVESRPQSGFYVRHRQAGQLVKPLQTNKAQPSVVRSRSLRQRVYDGLNDPALVPLGIANPTMARPATKALHRTMKRVMARAQDRSLSYSPTLGEPQLRRQIAFHYQDTIGVQVDPADIAVTNGAQEALLLALRAVADKGDIIAVETPTYHGLLELIDSLGMLALEVETCPEEGVVVGAVEHALKTHDVKACVFSTTLGNPLGVTMPDVDRHRLVKLLKEHDTVLIEDDVYGELRFDGERPMPAQFTEGSKNIISCGSFSKTASPGYRIGWICTSKYMDRIENLKRAFSATSGMIQQLTIAEFLATGEFNRHLKLLRSELKLNAERMASLIEQNFPSSIRMSRPAGGSVYWLQLPAGINGEQVFEEAIAAGISTTPGRLFSPCSCYDENLRLSFGHQWTERSADAVRWLGQRVTELTLAS